MIEHIIITSVCIVGVHLAVKEFVWTFTKTEVEAYYVTWPKWLQFITKPLFVCPTCMASVWGTVFHFYLSWLGTNVLGRCYQWEYVWELLPVTWFFCAFLNTLLNKWVK